MSNLKVTLTADLMHGWDASPILIQPIHGYQGFVPGGLLPTGPYDFIGNEHVGYETGQYGFSGRINWDLGSVALTSTTAWRHYLSRSYYYDSDTTPARLSAINNTDTGHNFTQEVLLASEGSHRFNWVLGGFYLRQDGQLDPLIVLSGPVTITRIEAQQITEASAVFGDGTLRLGQFEITADLRCSTRQDFSGQLNGIAGQP